MNGDFEKLASHEHFHKILFEYLKYRMKWTLDISKISTILNDVVNKKLLTSQALDRLSQEAKTEKHKDDINMIRGAARVRDLQLFSGLINPLDINRYLDIGCGNGYITAAVGKNLLGLKKEQIIGTDVKEWAGHDHSKEVSEDITFRQQVDVNVLPVESDSCDVITIMMVLHHIPDSVLMNIMQEIRRVATTSGIVIIREHDSPNHMIDSIINIEHGLFEVAIEKLTTGKKFQETYYGKYRSKRDWIMIFQEHGFDVIGDYVMNDKLATRPFYQVFKKNYNETIVNKSVPQLISTARRLGVKIQSGDNADKIRNLIINGRR